MKNCIFVFLVAFCLQARAQYPFEKLNAVKYEVFAGWKTEVGQNSLPQKRTIEIDFDKKSVLRIEQSFRISLPDSLDYSEINLFRNGNLAKTIEVGTRSISEPLPVFIADFNNDNLKDIKILFPNYGCGAFNYYCQTVFLFQKSDGSFDGFAFSDIYEEFENRPERDFNNDGTFEIMTQTFQRHGKHNYWLFNLYNYQGGKLVNVNDLADYPIMIPLLGHQVSKKIPKAKMKEFAIASPVP